MPACPYGVSRDNETSVALCFLSSLPLPMTYKYFVGGGGVQYTLRFDVLFYFFPYGKMLINTHAHTHTCD